jgi:membrane-associated phospholipid phosphatase
MRHNEGMKIREIWLLGMVAAALSGTSGAQSPNLPNAPQPSPDAATIRNLPRNFVRDQGAIWTSPLRVSEGGAFMSILFIAGAGALGAEDRHIMQNHFLDPSTNDHANTASTGLTGLFLAAPVAFYGLGHARHSSEMKEAGVLGGEAILDSVAVNEVFKIASRRERPTEDDAKGKFFQSGVGFESSFASNHSVIAWSSATVIASEYNGWLTKLTAYSLATGVSLTRVVGRDHFPSDVVVGSAVGWMIGRYVYHRHHREDSY